mgnify:CR=1 FL=1
MLFRSVAIFIDEQDSLFLHADTIKVLNDSLDRAEKLLAYNRMKFFRDDFQGACDSMIYSVPDSTIYMYTDPVLWSDENQLTSDSIHIFVSHNSIDSLRLYSYNIERYRGWVQSDQGTRNDRLLQG